MGQKVTNYGTRLIPHTHTAIYGLAYNTNDKQQICLLMHASTNLEIRIPPSVTATRTISVFSELKLMITNVQANVFRRFNSPACAIVSNSTGRI